MEPTTVVILLLVAALHGSYTAVYIWQPNLNGIENILSKVLACAKCNSFWSYQLLLAYTAHYGHLSYSLPLVLAGFAAAYAGEGLGELYARYDAYRDMQKIERLKSANKTTREVKWD